MDQKKCRVCNLTRDPSTLISPCLCDGPNKYTHRECLLILAESTCRTCNFKYIRRPAPLRDYILIYIRDMLITYTLLSTIIFITIKTTTYLFTLDSLIKQHGLFIALNIDILLFIGTITILSHITKMSTITIIIISYLLMGISDIVIGTYSNSIIYALSIPIIGIGIVGTITLLSEAFKLFFAQYKLQCDNPRIIDISKMSKKKIER